MGNTLEKHYTLITGASAGIGKQFAIECAEKGFNLFLVSLPNSGLEELVDELKQKFTVDIRFLSIDLIDYDSPKAVFEFAKKNGLTVNVLVNNAGVGFNGKFETLTPELIDQMILLNIRTSTLLTFLFLPEMEKLAKANVLNISSFAAFAPLQYKSVYAATKAYLLFLTRAINLELKGTNIKVTSVHPSGVSSERAMNNIKRSSFIARISTLTPNQVAKIAIKSMMNGDTFVVPGMVTKFYYYLGSFLPHGLVVRLVGYVFRKSA